MKMIAAAFVELETARLAKKLKAGGQLAGSKKGKRGAGKKGVSGGAIVGPPPATKKPQRIPKAKKKALAEMRPDPHRPPGRFRKSSSGGRGRMCGRAGRPLCDVRHSPEPGARASMVSTGPWGDT